MPKSSKLTSTKKRVKVKDLSATEKKMSGKDMKKVRGGITKTGTGTMVLSNANVIKTSGGDK
jgi:hypothetical protein